MIKHPTDETELKQCPFPHVLLNSFLIFQFTILCIFNTFTKPWTVQILIETFNGSNLNVIATPEYTPLSPLNILQSLLLGRYQAL